MSEGSAKTERRVEDLPRDLQPYFRPGYPGNASGSCIIMGTPPDSQEGREEPIAVDQVRAVLQAFLLSKANIGRGHSVRTSELLRVEVAGVLPRLLTQHTPDESGMPPREALNMLVNNGSAAQDANRDRAAIAGHTNIEIHRAEIVKGIVDALGLDHEEVTVRALSDKLTEPTGRMEFLSDFDTARRRLSGYIDLALGEKHQDLKRLVDALQKMIPNSVLEREGHNDPRVTDFLINYALTELLMMIRKIRKEIILMHPPREQGYINITRGYLFEAFGVGAPGSPEGDIVGKFVKLESGIDGMKLVPSDMIGRRRRGSQKKRERFEQNIPNTLRRLAACPAYRVKGSGNGPERRIVVYPQPDDVETIRDKILRPDIHPISRAQFVEEVLLGSLQLVSDVDSVARGNPFVRRRIRRDLGGLIDGSIELSPENLLDGQNLDRMLHVFQEFVVSLAYDGIRERVEGVAPMSRRVPEVMAGNDNTPPPVSPDGGVKSGPSSSSGVSGDEKGSDKGSNE